MTTFDLGGLQGTTVTQVVLDAFGPPFPPLPPLGGGGGDDGGRMIRITLVVGGGKNSRQRYDPNCLRLVTSALQSTTVMYREDRGASCIPECAGSYKVQHDTGKNLKTVVIFPRITQQQQQQQQQQQPQHAEQDRVIGGSVSRTGAAAGAGAAISSSLPSSSSFLLPPDSIESKVAVSTIPVFTSMLKHRFPTWSQKRSLVELMDDTIVAPLRECDDLLMMGKLLSDEQKAFYDSVRHIDDKRTLVKDAMHGHVERSDLTRNEIDVLLSQVEARIDELDGHGEQKQKHDQHQQQPTTAAAARAKLIERRTKLLDMTPIPFAPLKHHVELDRLWKQAAPLLHLNSSNNSNSQKATLLSVQETKKLGHLRDLLDEIRVLEDGSRGWLEEDNIYKARVTAYRDAVQRRYGKHVASVTTGNRTARVGSSTTAAPTTTTKAAGRGGGSSAAKVHLPTVGNAWMSHQQKKEAALKKKKSRMHRGDVFGAMMVDDSDDDDDKSGDGEEEGDDDGKNNHNKGEGDDDDDVSNSDKDEKDDEETAHGDNTNQPKVRGTTTSSAQNKKKKQHRKAKKGKSRGGYDVIASDDEDAVLSRAYAESMAAAKTKLEQEQLSKAEETAITRTFSFLRVHILPLIMALLTWMVTMMLGSKGTIANTKKKTKKQKAS
jgi:hypothetical protein